MGRKSTYNEETAQKICEGIAGTNRGLHFIAKELNISPSTIYEWLLDSDNLLNGNTFAEQYTRAREIQAERIMDETLEIADDETMDRLKNAEGGEFGNSVKVQRDRLRIDTRKFMAARLAPKKYGDAVKIDHTTNGKELPPSVISTLSDATLRELIEKIGGESAPGGEG